MKRAGSGGQWLTTGPSFFWFLVFLALPAAFLVAGAFREPTATGGLGEGWTLANFRAALAPEIWPVFWRTLWISLVVTAACLGLSLPVAWVVARGPVRGRPWLLLAVVIPFWTNFLIRIFDWRQIMHPEGTLKHVLVSLGFCEPADVLLYHPGAVILVSVYLYLPFAILPLYAAIEKFDDALLDAARDLGAGRWKAFATVLVPGVSRGVGTAFLLVFIPMLGSYVVPDLVGSVDSEMLGNLIARRKFSDRNLPLAAALSVVLTVAVLLPMALRWLWRKCRPPAGEAPA